MDAPSDELIQRWRCIRICKEFPAYKLHELRDTPARELLLALQQIDATQDAARRLASKKKSTKE